MRRRRGVMESGPTGERLLAAPRRARGPRAPEPRAPRELLVRSSLRGASLLFFVLAWHLVSSHRMSFVVVDFAHVPTPVETATAAAELIRSPKLLRHVES